MESGLKELSCYRLERAREMLVASEENLKVDQYRTSLDSPVGRKPRNSCRMQISLWRRYPNTLKCSVC